ncbi:MAG: ATP-binding protein [Gammaproteobacteria bacterium]|jgi:serine/threonine-protein kinase RsbW|nr:ATP-binding protein [Gammaproteobacteria bacterium]
MAGQAFKRSIDSVADIYRFSEDIMAAADIDESVRFPVHLAMEELFVNLVSYNPGARRDILIDVQIANAGVVVTITDHDAAEFDVTKERPVDTGASLRERKPGGLGLHLIQHMVDTLEYDYRGGRSRIRFSKEQGTTDV